MTPPGAPPSTSPSGSARRGARGSRDAAGPRSPRASPPPAKGRATGGGRPASRKGAAPRTPRPGARELDSAAWWRKAGARGQEGGGGAGLVTEVGFGAPSVAGWRGGFSSPGLAGKRRAPGSALSAPARTPEGGSSGGRDRELRRSGVQGRPRPRSSGPSRARGARAWAASAPALRTPGSTARSTLTPRSLALPSCPTLLSSGLGLPPTRQPPLNTVRL